MKADGRQWHDDHREIIDTIRNIRYGEGKEYKSAYDYLISLYDGWIRLKEGDNESRRNNIDSYRTDNVGTTRC